jgi:hypothetical protein
MTAKDGSMTDLDDAHAPAPDDLRIGGQVLLAFAHARRLGRHGRQVLISHAGKFVWVPAELVYPRATDADDQQSA